MNQISARFYGEFYGAPKMLVSTISMTKGKMVGRDGFEPSTNWLKGISRLLKNQWVRCRNFTLRRPIVPLRINNLHIGFTELLTLKTLHPQSNGVLHD